MKKPELEELFDQYKKACYGDKKLPYLQLRETRQAFYSGILVALEVGVKDKDPLETVAALSELTMVKK